MTKVRVQWLAATLLLSPLVAGPAAAVSFDASYTVDGYDSNGGGLKIETSVLGPLSFSLEIGESYTTDLFRIWTNETSISNGDDTVPQPISVLFNFTAPAGTGDVDGTTVGSRLDGNVQQGRVTWTTPLPFALTQFSLGDVLLAVTLTNQIFNNGLRLSEGESNGAIVAGTFTLLSAPPNEAPPPAVPLPGALLLMGTVLAGSAGVAKLRGSRSPRTTA